MSEFITSDSSVSPVTKQLSEMALAVPSVEAASNFLFDALIIGSGPAGIAAALGLCRVIRPTIVFDTGVFRNAPASHMHTMPTWEHHPASEFRAAAKKEILDRYDTTRFAGTGVQTIQKGPDGRFHVTDTKGRKFKGKKVVVATGSRDILPDIPGYKEAWGKGIFHCFFCHGYEDRGAENGAILLTDDNTPAIDTAITNSIIAFQLTKNVTIFSNGNSGPSILANPKFAAAQAKGVQLDTRPIAGFKWLAEGEAAKTEITFRDGTKKVVGFVVHKPSTTSESPIIEQLGLEMTPGKDIKILSPLQDTTVPGVFAAGDCSGPLKQVLIALSQGLTTAAGINAQLAGEELTVS